MTNQDFVPLQDFPDYLINKLGEIKNIHLNRIKKIGVHTFTAGGFQWRYTNE